MSHDSVVVSYGVCADCKRAQLTLTKEGGSDDGTTTSVCLTEDAMLHVAAFLTTFVVRCDKPQFERMHAHMHDLMKQFNAAWDQIGPAPQGRMQ